MTALRAVLFDLDGTLYHQSPVRKRMAIELGLFLLRSPFRGPKTVRGISVFRKLREDLRELGQAEESLEELQYTHPAAEAGLDADRLRKDVEEWMIRRPLPFVAANARKELSQVLEGLRSRGLELGVYSDYPVREKLEAMGCRSFFSLELCSTDAEINAFKPHPRGFLHACERWGLQPEEVLFVGDREDVDAGGARNAGMPCALVGSQEGPGKTPTFPSLDSLVEGMLAD